MAPNPEKDAAVVTGAPNEKLDDKAVVFAGVEPNVLAGEQAPEPNWKTPKGVLEGLLQIKM